ncbi:AzlD domain-containing protein [Arcanobacterium haemolyticum]|nr:AzlD domain-containing protein [Arcanobacterium haemolyticum]
MPSTGYLVAGIGIAMVVTWALRAVPFALLSPLRDNKLVGYLGERMPLGIMVILTVYTLHGIDLVSWRESVPAAAALLVTIGLQFWRRNLILSVFAGTLVNVVLVSALS